MNKKNNLNTINVTYHGAFLLHDLLLHGFVHHAADLLLLAGLDGHVLTGHLRNLVTALLALYRNRGREGQGWPDLPTLGTFLQSSTSWQD